MTKNETKHTPGPWYEAKMGNDHQGLVVDEKTGANIAVIYDKANARLIAAAPELLEAICFLLKEYDQHIPENCDCPDVLRAADKARAAISKSRGL